MNLVLAISQDLLLQRVSSYQESTSKRMILKSLRLMTAKTSPKSIVINMRR